MKEERLTSSDETPVDRRIMAPTTSFMASTSSDELSLQRTIMASTRTFMAWTRTALSLISFGFSIPKILEYSNVQRFTNRGSRPDGNGRS